jgi:hypothetical protein
MGGVWRIIIVTTERFDMAAWQFKANGKNHIAVKNTAGKWHVMDWDRKVLPGVPYRTRAEAMRATIGKV